MKHEGSNTAQGREHFRRDGLRGLIIMTLSCLALIACNHPTTKHHTPSQSYTVQMKSLPKTLHFTGIIQPLRENSLTCPIDAIVESMSYHFGQAIQKNTVIFKLSSTELQRQYNDTLTDYLKAKDAYTMAKTKFNGTEELWKEGLLSKNNYLNEKSSLNTLRIGLIQASRRLSEMLEKAGSNKKEDISTLSFAEFDKVRKALDGKHNLIYVRAQHNGILLYPPKSIYDKQGKVGVGSSLKAGQVMALIGDLSGIRVEIDIPEVDISALSIGMPATVRGVAFGDHELHGTLVAINAQASSASHGALPSFNAIVEVRNLSPKEQAWIKVGMSASIDITLAEDHKLFIPISAVQQKGDQRVVNLKTTEGTVQSRVVTTGVINQGQVAIEKGLRAGDVILYG